jgi:NAD(P)-dependent dehydrogenase (short-subunit alcohol dehydrogenase family)
MAGLGDVLIVGLGAARAPAIERRLAADGYNPVALREAGEDGCGPGFRGAGDGDIATLLEDRAPGFRPDAVVFVSDPPAAAAPGDTPVSQLIDALDGALVTAGLVAKALFTRDAPKPPARAVLVLDWAVTSTPRRTAASAVSGGLLGLARSWSLEFAPLGITANAIVAGPDAGADPVLDPADEAWLVRRPTPDDVAHAVSFFVDRRSSAITGQVLMVCGGRTAGRLTI